jgi:hypothetical protein
MKKSIAVKPRRKRKAANLTLSDEAREMGRALAESDGIKLSQLVEQLLRRELREKGFLKGPQPEP